MNNQIHKIFSISLQFTTRACKKETSSNTMNSQYNYEMDTKCKHMKHKSKKLWFLRLYLSNKECLH